MILKGKFVTLRPIEAEDLEFIRTMLNDPWFERMIIGWSYPISKKDQEAWYANLKIMILRLGSLLRQKRMVWWVLLD